MFIYHSLGVAVSLGLLVSYICEEETKALQVDPLWGKDHCVYKYRTCILSRIVG